MALFAGTCILFGDGCGAVVMTSQEGSCSLLGSSMCSDGLGQKHLKVCTVSNPTASPMHQNKNQGKMLLYKVEYLRGPQVFVHIGAKISGCTHCMMWV